MDKKTGGQAFPGNEFAEGSYSQGMSLRDWFAGQALAGLIASPNCSLYEMSKKRALDNAELCYLLADAMLKERDK